MITVGDNGKSKTFPVYHGLLCLYSAYFNNFFNGSFKEAGSKAIDVKIVSTETSQLFFYWITTGTFGRLLEATNLAVYNDIVDLYIFGDWAMIPRLKNAAMDIFLEELNTIWKIPYPKTIKTIYDNTTENSPIRRFIVDFFVDWSIWKSDIEGQAPKEFFLDLIEAIRGEDSVYPKKKNTSKRAWFKSMKARMCEYHDHIEIKPTFPVTSSTPPSDEDDKETGLK